MRALPSAVAAHLASGGGIAVHALIWITARDRTTNAPVTLGIWTGADTQSITVSGVSRTYHGLGALLDLDPLSAGADLRERQWSFTVSPLHEAVISAIREYNARLAPVEVHEWHFDPLTNAPLADPVRVFRGSIMTVSMPVPALDQDATATISCVSDAWRLTRGLTLKRSDSALQARETGDDFRKYNDLVGVETWWGEKSKTTAGGGGQTPPPYRPPTPGV